MVTCDQENLPTSGSSPSYHPTKQNSFHTAFQKKQKKKQWFDTQKPYYPHGWAEGGICMASAPEIFSIAHSRASV